MEEEQFQSYQAEVANEEEDQGRERIPLSAEDQLKLERAAASNAMVYIQQYIKAQSLLQALQVQLTDYQDTLHKNRLEQMREEKRGRTLSPERIEELREVVSFFCPKDPDTLIGKAWVAYHMHSAHAEPVANPGLLLKRSKKDDMLAVWKAHGLNLFERSTRRDATGFAFNLATLPLARRVMLDMRARGLDCASKNPRKRKRITTQHEHHEDHEQHEHHPHNHQPEHSRTQLPQLPQQLSQQQLLPPQHHHHHQQHQPLQHLQLQHRQQQQQQQQLQQQQLQQQQLQQQQLQQLQQQQLQQQQLQQQQLQLQQLQQQRRQQQEQREESHGQHSHLPQHPQHSHPSQHSHSHVEQGQDQAQRQRQEEEGRQGRLAGGDAQTRQEEHQGDRRHEEMRLEQPQAVHLLPHATATQSPQHEGPGSEEKKSLPVSPVALNIVDAVLDGSLKEGPVLSQGFSDLLGGGEDLGPGEGPNLPILSD